MPRYKTYGLFISYACTHNGELDRLVQKLRAAPNFKPQDHSVRSKTH